MQFTIKTNKREEVINITREVQTMVSRYSVKEGLCHVFIPHATAAITINENSDKQVCEDFLESLKKIAPKGQWKHDKNKEIFGMSKTQSVLQHDSCDGNGDAHIKSALIGPSISVPIQNNRLLLGRWQGIMFCEFDGPRERTILVSIVNTVNK